MGSSSFSSVGVGGVNVANNISFDTTVESTRGFLVGENGSISCDNLVANGSLTADRGAFVNNGAGINDGLTVNGGATVNGGFTSYGGSGINDGLTVNGGATVNGGFTSYGGSSINGELTVNGGTTVNGSVVVSNNVTVSSLSSGILASDGEGNISSTGVPSAAIFTPAYGSFYSTTQSTYPYPSLVKDGIETAVSSGITVRGPLVEVSVGGIYAVSYTVYVSELSSDTTPPVIFGIAHNNQYFTAASGANLAQDTVCATSSNGVTLIGQGIISLNNGDYVAILVNNPYGDATGVTIGHSTHNITSFTLRIHRIA
jgi:hypothetical protein